MQKIYILHGAGAKGDGHILFQAACIEARHKFFCAFQAGHTLFYNT